MNKSSRHSVISESESSVSKMYSKEESMLCRREYVSIVID